MGSTMKGLPVQLQPDEKCRTAGAEHLDDSELLAVVLRTGTRGMSALELTRELLKEAGGTLNGLKKMSVPEMMKIPGIGEVKALQIRCILTLAARIGAESIRSGEVFSSPERIAAYCMEEMRTLSQEEVRVMYLDTKSRLIRMETVSRGTVNGSLFPFREILIRALKCEAVYMILLHNHPSGDPTPSQEDLDATRQAESGCRIAGIPLLDHIIIGDRIYYSMREQGLLK